MVKYNTPNQTVDLADTEKPCDVFGDVCIVAEKRRTSWIKHFLNDDLYKIIEAAVGQSVCLCCLLSDGGFLISAYGTLIITDCVCVCTQSSYTINIKQEHK